MRYPICLLVALLAGAVAGRADPVLNPDNGHHYELVMVQTTWEAARQLAGAMSYAGDQGYLATITSAAENEFVDDTFNTGNQATYCWIGGYEPNDDGVWLWGAGPEAGIQFSNGSAPTPPFHYANWGGIEPNDYAPGEDFAAFNIGLPFLDMAAGTWIDSPNPNPSDPVVGYLVEYGTGPTQVERPPSLSVSLEQNYPNPFNPTTTLRFELQRACQVHLAVYDLSGRLVRTLVNGEEVAAGSREAIWDGRSDAGRPAAAGTYFCRMEAGSYRGAIRMTLVK